MKGFDTRLPWAAITVLLALGFLLAAAGPTLARELSWYVGGGFARSSISGELDGNDVFFPFNDPVNGPFVFGADLEDGGGLALNFGFALNRFVAFEVLHTATRHDAKSAGLPGEPLDASVNALLLGVRGMLPLGDALELFARFGLGGYALSIERNVETPPNPNRQDSTFSGGGAGYGLGVAYALGRFGIELGFNRHEIDLDTLDATDNISSIPSQDMTLDTADLVFTFHFGSRL